jgi:diguanylate cyclase (GGDEF)-like protein
MDRWERRLHLMARTSASGSVAPAAGPDVRPHLIDARDLPVAPPGSDVAELIHPDEAAFVRSLLDLAAGRPELMAEVPLLTRNHDRWEYHLFELVHEIMGPVLRLVDPSADSGDDPAGGNRSGGDERSLSPLDRNDVIAHLAGALDRAGDHLVAVMLIDLDRFKLHNDMLGDAGGDELLAVFADRLAKTVGGAFSAWMGGDEFIAVLEGLDDPAKAQVLAEDVRRAIAEPVAMPTEKLHVTATIGLSVGSATTSPTHLLRDADTAVFAGKDRGRDRVQVFGRQLGAQIARQLSTAQRLRRALAAGTLELHYQPVVSLDSGMVVAAEALMRIAGDEARTEPLSPSSLIDAAEDSGLIARLGRYVLEETTSQIARWRDHLADGRIFRVSVNVSPVQLHNRDFSGAIAHALKAADVSPSRLSLELTESVLLGANPTIDLVVQDLAELGIAFGLDDFGAEGSSLGGLRRFPIEFLKIDRSLVDALDGDERVEAIVSSMVTLAHQLGFSTVAVGVERESQRDLLRSLGCDSAQGYLFSPPLTAEAFTDQF